MYEYDAENRLLKRSYWTETGLHQEHYNKLSKLVPDADESDDRWIELLRCMGNVYHECYSNGGCNLEVKSDELDTILHSQEVREMVEADLWKQFKATVVAHRDYLSDSGGLYKDGDDECVDDGVDVYLQDICGHKWMEPLEAVADAVIEVCAAKLLRI